MKKRVCCFLALMTLLLAVPVLAAQHIPTNDQRLITPQFMFILFTDSHLTITSMGEATCTGAAMLYTPPNR